MPNPRQFGHPDRLGIAATGRWGQVVSLVEDYPVGLKQVEHPSTRGGKIAWADDDHRFFQVYITHVRLLEMKHLQHLVVLRSPAATMCMFM